MNWKDFLLSAASVLVLFVTVTLMVWSFANAIDLEIKQQQTTYGE